MFGKEFGNHCSENTKAYLKTHIQIPSLSILDYCIRCFNPILLKNTSLLQKAFGHLDNGASRLYATMALNGVWQLQKLVVRWCDWGGSSRGIREFIQSRLPDFRQQNPQLKVEVEMLRGKHPHLRGYYRNKTVRMVDARNMQPENILLEATRLRNALGRKVIKLKTRHVTKNPSVQGTWKTDLKL